MRYSCPSIFTSLPPYWPKITVSPTLTPIGETSPESFFLPGPTAITSPCEGFSVAVPERMMPPADVFSSSFLSTTTLSCKGLNFITSLLVKNYYMSFKLAQYYIQ